MYAKLIRLVPFVKVINGKIWIKYPNPNTTLKHRIHRSLLGSSGRYSVAVLDRMKLQLRKPKIPSFKGDFPPKLLSWRSCRRKAFGC
jgi:hypothetical protein